MSKIVNRIILPFQESNFFFAIRSKIDYARIVVLAARQLILNTPAGNLEIKASMRLVIDKMTRLFFYKDHKYYSLAFPFNPLFGDKGEILEVVTRSGKILDNESISSIISILDSNEFKINPSLIDVYIEPQSFDANALFLLEEIFQFEPSYVRYDCDPENENGDIHPKNHLDVNYSQYATFKLGLTKSISEAYFEDLQNITTKCMFIKQ